MLNNISQRFESEADTQFSDSVSQNFDQKRAKEIVYKVATFNIPESFESATNFSKSAEIIFPRVLTGDLISYFARKTKSNTDRWGFIADPHFNQLDRLAANLPKSSKPSDLLKRLDAGEKLTLDEEGVLEDYFHDYHMVASLTDKAITDAREKSNYDDQMLLLAFDKYQPKDLLSKRQQKNERAAIDANPVLKKEASSLDKKFRKIQSAATEGIALHAGLVGGDCGQKRCTKAAIRSRKHQLDMQDKFSNDYVVFNENTGEIFQLPNTNVKRHAKLSEMYVYAKGLEQQLALDGQCGWLSAVVTAPSHMHPNPKHGINTWSGILPSESVKYFTKKWALFRARCAKHQIQISGLWTRESHLDACPHMNFLIGFENEHYREVKKLLIEIFGHSKRAVKIQMGGKSINDTRVDFKPASFATYAMKYFMKNFQEFGNDDDSDAEETTASIFGYRRHGFFGVPSLVHWRELRRLKEQPNDTQAIKNLWLAVKNGDASTWIEQNGGLACRRGNRPIQSLRENQKIIGIKEIATKNMLVTTKMFKGWTYVKKEVIKLARQTGGNAEYCLLTQERQYHDVVIAVKEKDTLCEIITKTETYSMRKNLKLESQVTVSLNYPSVVEVNSKFGIPEKFKLLSINSIKFSDYKQAHTRALGPLVACVGFVPIPSTPLSVCAHYD